MRTFEGKFDGRNVKIAIVAGRFNEFITSKLIGGKGSRTGRCGWITLIEIGRASCRERV